MQGPARTDQKNNPDVISGGANESVVKIVGIQKYYGHLSSIACDA
jgi:hypothetical protein